jgi:hypothetical protein
MKKANEYRILGETHGLDDDFGPFPTKSVSENQLKKLKKKHPDREFAVFAINHSRQRSMA